MIQVGGYEPATVIDFEIPKKYGLRQTIGDTLGIGGIMRGLRTIPVLLDIARDMEALCPDALLINYANPMCMNQWALSRASDIARSAYATACRAPRTSWRAISALPYEDINYLVAGINHMAFYLKFERRATGEDLYPLLHRVYEEGVPPHQPRALRDAQAAGLFRHRVERALQRICALVHQDSARKRADRANSISRWTNTSSAAKPASSVGSCWSRRRRTGAFPARRKSCRLCAMSNPMQRVDRAQHHQT